MSCFQLPSHLFNTPSLCAAPSAASSVPLSFFFPIVFLVYVSCHLFLIVLLNFLALEAECINPLTLPLLQYLCCHGFVHHSFTFTAALSPELILGHQQPIIPLCLLISMFTLLSSLPPHSQKTCKASLSLPACCFLLLSSQMLFTNDCAKGLERGRRAFSMSGKQQTQTWFNGHNAVW